MQTHPIKPSASRHGKRVSLVARSPFKKATSIFAKKHGRIKRNSKQGRN